MVSANATWSRYPTKPVFLLVWTLLIASQVSCSSGTGGDCGEPFNSGAGWLVADDWVKLQPESAIPQPTDSTATLSLEVKDLLPGARPHGPTYSTPIAMHGSFYGQVSEAIAAGDDAYLALMRDRSQPLVEYIVFHRTDGSYDFSQQCWLPGVEDGIRSTYGNQADQMIQQLVGTTGKSNTYALFKELRSG